MTFRKIARKASPVWKRKRSEEFLFNYGSPWDFQDWTAIVDWNPSRLKRRFSVDPAQVFGQSIPRFERNRGSQSAMTFDSCGELVVNSCFFTPYFGCDSNDFLDMLIHVTPARMNECAGWILQNEDGRPFCMTSSESWEKSGRSCPTWVREPSLTGRYDGVDYVPKRCSDFPDANHRQSTFPMVKTGYSKTNWPMTSQYMHYRPQATHFDLLGACISADGGWCGSDSFSKKHKQHTWTCCILCRNC